MTAGQASMMRMQLNAEHHFEAAPETNHALKKERFE